MKIAAVIPARYGSTRFPGKPLFSILGKPMLQWVIEGVRASPLLSEVVVASDHPEILELARRSGVRALATSDSLPTGTDRVRACLEALSDIDAVLNIQGDEPMVNASLVEALVHCLQKDAESPMATLAASLQLEQLSNLDVVKVLVNSRARATYFSRFPVPYSRQEPLVKDNSGVFRHLGFYAYRRDFLKEFCSWPQGDWERAESLEQLRALQRGVSIAVQVTDFQGLSVDRPEDVPPVEKRLRELCSSPSSVRISGL